MKPQTVARHLKALARRLEDSDFSTQSEDRAVREAIEIVRRHQVIQFVAWFMTPPDSPGDKHFTSDAFARTVDTKSTTKRKPK